MSDKLTIPDLSDQIRLYQEAFALHGDSPAAVLWPRGRQPLRFEALTGHFCKSRFSVLDYGCGLAHLKDYLDERFSEYSYVGVDAVPDFVQAVKKKHPDALVYQVGSHLDVVEPVDHVVVSGTFNIIHDEGDRDYLSYVREALLHLFGICNISLSVNFMTDKVDYRQPRSHHVNVEAMYQFVRDHLSPRLVLDQSYMPYEFNIVAFRNRNIVRPENVYEAI
jgi:SAM-dependent methyltransferase